MNNQLCAERERRTEGDKERPHIMYTYSVVELENSLY